MEIVTVTKNNVHLLKDFINNLGSASETFRYFNFRTTEVIANHLTTLLALEESNPVAYGHLDVENEVTWLGICVLPDSQNKGYGKYIMHELINLAKQLEIKTINLSVDKDNITAIKLYENFSFKKEIEFKSSYKYSLTF